MNKLVAIINELQDVFNTIGGQLIDLPQIVVVGSQSSGKSSVLESIVGHDFLPRGSGIVTRRPLVLQLVHIQDGEEEYGEFLHKKGQKFTNFKDMCKEISEETDRTTGKGRNVSPQPINLCIRSTNVPTLTMVDLPGLTKVAVEGQDPAIVEQIHTMVLQYITPKNSIILAISPANQDIANSDSLRIAHQVDPEGERTIGVITKIDLMDAGTDASSILNNSIYPLRMGYIAVINRSQRDIDSNKSMRAQLKSESEYFSSNPIYRNMLDRCGTKVLSDTLTRILVEHIRKSIPSLRTRVNQLIQDKENELKKYGSDPSSTQLNPREIVLKIITSYKSGFEDLIAGRVGNEINDDLKGGARIQHIFTTQFQKEISEVPSVSKANPREIWFLMKNHCGITVPIYAPHQAFESIIRRYIEKLRPPALKAINSVANEILNIHSQVTFPELEHYPQVKDAIRNVVEDLVNNCVEPTIQFVNTVIDNEKIFINTARHDFRGAAVLQEKKQKESVPKKKTQNQIEVENTKILMSRCARYFELIRIQIADLVPKAIVLMLVEGSSKKLHDILLNKIYSSGLADDIMKEDPRITANRNKCLAVLDKLKQAQTILNKVRQVNI
ncbi:Dynamin central region family protein [Histomonas meleagridis]|uniref:Dynamin central region family protein n=1 Tax=Histomonas meleagridis TaxID=135588 RepID=UPI003559DC63|nr:Dynamin central region family protein [Histomonas meleagridis]KAH0799459.1 Dynamin central region family protein [Histomonas meleagridis]